MKMLEKQRLVKAVQTKRFAMHLKFQKTLIKVAPVSRMRMQAKLLPVMDVQIKTFVRVDRQRR